MTALAAGRLTPSREDRVLKLPVAAAKKIYEGALVALSATGYATPGAVATTIRGIGRARATVDNSGGSAGDLSVEVDQGVFRFGNSTSTDEITAAEIGQVCYIVDDQTVAKTNGSSTRSRAGHIVDVDAQGVWVRLGLGLLDAPAGALAAANNLSDVGAAATARANLGANKGSLHIEVADLTGTGVYRVVAPRAGTITKVYSVIDGVLTTGNATLTTKIGATGVTDGVITITQAGSAAGDVDSATPSAANTFVAGDVISVTVGGTNATASGAKVTVEFTF